MKNMKIRDTKKRTENKRIREGDYAKPGVTIQGEWTTFTFDAEKEDSCFVVLKDMQTEKEEKIHRQIESENLSAFFYCHQKEENRYATKRISQTAQGSV